MKSFKILSIIIAALIISSCVRHEATDQKNQEVQSGTVEIEKQDILITEPLSKQEQTKLKPEDVVKRLMDGNKDFVEDNLTVRNTAERVRKASLGQYPKAVILSCLDSRVPVEDVFHSGIGNLFVARVAGNIVNKDILGSMEYACKVSGAKVVFVLGHEYCGAVKSAIDGVKLGNITGLLERIKPAVFRVTKNFTPKRDSSDARFVEEVCEENVRQAINEIRRGSSILKEMEDSKQILIVGGVYDMKTGKVSMLDLN